MLLDKNVSDKTIKEEGERMVPAFHKGALVYGEHLVRYEGVIPLVKGKVVLDIASGSGYGTFVLASAAKKVYGVEIDKDSVAYSKKNYSKSNIEYLQGSAEAIPLADNSVDVVVTFETIEHIKNYKKFLSEMKRVLKPDGVALVSTPNDPEFPEDNHFHLHEFEYDELKAELKKHFEHIEFSFQYTWLYTAMLTDEQAKAEWNKEIETENYAPVPKEKAIYFMAVCSNKPLDGIPKVKQLAAISEHWSARQVQQDARAKESEIKALHEELNTKRQELKSIYNSKGWKLLVKLYAIEGAVRKPFSRK